MNSLFYFFGSLALVSGVMVIQARNPVHSVLFLILVFFNVAGLLILLGLDFFAMIFLVVYVGAIAVLFLFVVMMLNIKLAEINEKRLRYLPIGGLLGILFLFEIFLIVDNDLIPLVSHSHSFFLSGGFVQYSSLIESVTNIESVGLLLYTYYFDFFIIASLILQSLKYCKTQYANAFEGVPRMTSSTSCTMCKWMMILCSTQSYHCRL